MCKASLQNAQKKRKAAPIDDTLFACNHKRQKRTLFQRVNALLLRALTGHYVFVVLGSCACLPTSLVAANCCWWWCASKEAHTHVAETFRLRLGTCPLAHPRHTRRLAPTWQLHAFLPDRIWRDPPPQRTRVVTGTTCSPYVR